MEVPEGHVVINNVLYQKRNIRPSIGFRQEKGQSNPPEWAKISILYCRKNSVPRPITDEFQWDEMTIDQFTQPDLTTAAANLSAVLK